MLLACNDIQKSSSLFRYTNNLFSYSIDIPKSIWIEGKSATGAQIFFGNIPFSKENTKGDEADVLIYGSNTNCSSLGASKTEVVSLGSWGRVDFWEKNGAYYVDPEPFCEPPIIYVDFCGEAGVNTEEDKKEYSECIARRANRLPVAAYAFCAEKDGKAVAICIQQMTDNEEMAREIFESFRWTD